MVAFAPAKKAIVDSLSRDIRGLFLACSMADNPLLNSFIRPLQKYSATNSPAVAPGLYHYNFKYSQGKRRLHLRVSPANSLEQQTACGGGVLFVDVTDAIHLSPTATQMTKYALDGIPLVEAEFLLRREYRQTTANSIRRDLARIYAMVEQIVDNPTGCTTCAIGEHQRAALFSTAVTAPYKADIALTYGCNNECPHCYNEPERLGMQSLNADQWKLVIEKLIAVGVPHLIFTGGEATLHPDLPELIYTADQLGAIVGLNSNGRRIAHAPYMKELEQAGLNHLQITLGSSRADAHDRIMGTTSFHQTIKGIEQAVNSGVHVITNTTLMKSNSEYVEEIIDFIGQLGISTFAMNSMIYSGGGFCSDQALSESELPSLLLRIRDHAISKSMRFLWYTPTEYCRMSPVELEIGAKRCNAGEYSLCIEPNGDVLPCQSYYASVGNMLRDPWESIWQSQLFRSFREREDDPRGWGLPEKCWECADLPLCGGGCRIEREARDGRRTAEESGSSGGCSSGGCSSGGCSSGGCGKKSSGSNTNYKENASSGFIPISALTKTRRRGSGEFRTG